MLNKYCLNYRGYWFGGVEDVQRLRGKIVSLCPNDDVMYQESTHNLVAPNLLARPTNGSDAFDDKIIVKHIHRKDKRHRKKKGGKIVQEYSFEKSHCQSLLEHASFQQIKFVRGTSQLHKDKIQNGCLSGKHCVGAQFDSTLMLWFKLEKRRQKISATGTDSESYQVKLAQVDNRSHIS